MAFMALQAAPENSEAAALLILQEIVKKSLFMHNSDKQKVEDYIFKEKIPLFKVKNDSNREEFNTFSTNIYFLIVFFSVATEIRRSSAQPIS